jgi:hypothetical protein
MNWTDAELKAFETEEDIQFKEIDNKVSSKTNIYILSKDFVLSTIFLSKLKAYAIYLSKLINIDNLINTVISKLQSNKNVLIINSNLVIDGSSTQKINNNISYKITRVSEFIIEITNIDDAGWFTDNLIVQLKTIDGVIIYPVISTTNNKITIHFIDGITIDYKIYFM